jgi:hypothetical protein
MRSPAAALALAATLAAAPAVAQQPPATHALTPPPPAEPAATPPPPAEPAATAPVAAPPVAPQPPAALPAPAQPYPYAYPYAPPPYAAPYGWAPMPPPVTERRSQGMRIAGITLFAAGGVVTVAGLGVFLTSALHPCVYYAAADALTSSGAAHGERVGTGRQALTSCDGGPTLGLGILAGGLLGGVLGIPFFVVGNGRVPARPPGLSVAPRVRLNATGADLRWTF